MAGARPDGVREPARLPERGGGADQASMRRTNLGLILRHLRDHGGQSRARVATETGLSKATLSSLIADLVERGLVTEGELERGGTVGRPGLTLHVDGRHVAGVGLEINVDFLAITAVDLTGRVLAESTRPLDTASLPLEEVVDVAADLVTRATRSLRARGVRPVAVTVAVPGSIDPAAGRVMFAPNVGWRDVPLVRELSARLGRTAPPVVIENDAKLGAVAEHTLVAASGIDDLVYLTGDVGVGAGIIVEGHVLRGASGFAGEVGHIPLDPAGGPCACGRRGCWETMVGLGAFLRLAADEGDPVRDPRRPLEERLGEVHRRAGDGDPRAVAAVERVGRDLGVGLSVLVDLFDPRLVVLGGWFAYFREALVPPLQATLAARALTDSVPRVTASDLGLAAASRGGAHLALESVFRDPGGIDPPRASSRPA